MACAMSGLHAVEIKIAAPTTDAYSLVSISFSRKCSSRSFGLMSSVLRTSVSDIIGTLLTPIPDSHSLSSNRALILSSTSKVRIPLALRGGAGICRFVDSSSSDSSAASAFQSQFS